MPSRSDAKIPLIQSLRESTRQTAATFGLAWRSSPGGLLATAGLTLASALLPLLIAYIGKLIIDAAVAGSRPATLRYVALELVVVVVQVLLQRALLLMRALLGNRLGLDVGVAILDKSLSLDLPKFEDPDFYDRLVRARAEAATRPLALITDVLQAAQNVVTLLGYVGLLLAYNAWMVAILFLAALPATIVEMRFAHVSFRRRNLRSPDVRRFNYLEYVLTSDLHAKEVRLFGLGPMFLKRYQGFGESFFREDRAHSIRQMSLAYLFSLIATGVFYGGYILLALAAAAHAITIGSFTLYLVAFRQGQQAFQNSLVSLGNLYEHNLYLSNLFEFLSIPGKRAPSSPVVTLWPQRTGEIRFENVGFRYPGNEEWALRGITLTIPPGQNVALVGHNGAGKSTLIKLLCGFYEPTEGCILLDGRDLRSWAPEELRERISAVFQDFNRYHMTLRENIGFGDLPHANEAPRVVKAVEKSGADGLVGSLPNGLDTQLGRWFPQGVELSGGQWQKVALARAFMRESADILILDEPTSALDVETEQAIFERFRALTRDRTSLLISHRFSTVRIAERILVIEGGHVMEDGDHESLMHAGGRYAHLFQLQARGYV